MIQALWSASSGMLAQQMNLDNIANNMANVNTVGYKKSKVEFQDMLYSVMREPDRRTLRGETVPTWFQTGHGVMPVANQVIFEQGALQETGKALDFAIDGSGFFAVQLPDGTTAYTRAGSFSVDGEGQLVNASGYPVLTQDGSPIVIDDPSAGITVDSNGQIMQNDQTVGAIGVFSFTNPAGLERAGANLYLATVNSGEEMPADEAAYKLAQGMTEAANVNVAEEMTGMMIAQRAYELSSRAIRTADDMLGMANSLLRR
ncbi:MAG: flagellar basal-body rod protein FlgG [Bacillota bacterium]